MVRCMVSGPLKNGWCFGGFLSMIVLNCRKKRCVLPGAFWEIEHLERNEKRDLLHGRMVGMIGVNV